MRQQYVISPEERSSASVSSLSGDHASRTASRSYLQYPALRDRAASFQDEADSDRQPTKKAFTMRLDADVLAWFQSQGRGYQTRINKLLRQHMEMQEP